MKDLANASFPPDTIALMKGAMDAAAETVLPTAQDGERNPAALQRLALMELRMNSRE
jgi:hypothetical protein